MNNVIIFLPENEYKNWKGYLYGDVFHSKFGTAIYVYGEESSSSYQYSPHYKCIGEIVIEENYIVRENWLYIQLKNDCIEKVSLYPTKICSFIVILYNRNHIKRSEWLEKVKFPENDILFHLIRDVKKEPTTYKSQISIIDKQLGFVISKMLPIFKRSLYFFQKTWLTPVLQMSTFGLHLTNTLESFFLILNNFIVKINLSVAYRNYILARILDALLGQIIILYVMSYTTSSEMFLALTEFQECVVTHMKNTVEWLMGSPAGFKLNYPLNNLLGPFYQFHISLWWTFLKISNPILSILFNCFLYLGNFGFSFQVAILTDLLAIVSVHIYCIYVYAARLYFFQMKGLKILFRLFIGKKREPLPGTYESLPYTTEQLLFGTVSFTILLFLLPTTLTYYSVFTAIRIILIFVGGILTRLRHFMNIFPMYITWLWFFNPIPLTCTVRLSNKMNYLSNGILIIKMKLVSEGWWNTVTMNIPKNVKGPDDIEWKKLTSDVLTGNLIYPV